MIIFLHGPDTYRSRKKMREIVEHYRARHEIVDLARFDATQADWLAPFKLFISAHSLFASKKLALVEQIVSAKNKNAGAKEILADTELLESKDIIVLVYDPAAKIAAQWSFLTKKPVSVQEFKELKGAELERWIAAEAHASGFEINAEGATALISKFGSDTWSLHAVIEKLALMGKTSISLRDIVLVCDLEKERSAFEFADLFWKKDPGRFAAYEQLRISGEDSAMLFNLIASQSRTVELLKSGLRSLIDAHPFVVRKLEQHTQKHSLAQVSTLRELLAQLDVDVKSGRLDYEVATTSLLSNGL